MAVQMSWRWLRFLRPGPTLPTQTVVVRAGELSLRCRYRQGRWLAEEVRQHGRFWQLLPGHLAPARALQTQVSYRELARALPYLAEPLLPRPMEQLRVATTLEPRQASPLRIWVAYANPAHCTAAEEAEGLLPASMALSQLPRWIEQYAPEAPSTTLWGLEAQASWMVALVTEGRVLQIRCMPQGDLLSLRIAQEELHHSGEAPCRWMGKSAPPGWLAMEVHAERALLEMAAWTLLHSTSRPSLLPSSWRRELGALHTQRTLWGLAAAAWILLGCLWGWGQWSCEELEEQVGFPLASLETETERVRLEIAQGRAPFAVEPTLPRVRDLLCWLATLPELGEQAHVGVDSLRYQLTSYPSAGKEKQPYKGKVSMEITCNDAFKARQLLEAVSSPSAKSPVETGAPLEWTHQQGRYRLGFQLKTSKRSEAR